MIARVQWNDIKNLYHCFYSDQIDLGEVDSCMCAWEALLSCYILGCSVLAINACLQNYSSTWWLTLNLNGNARLRLIILKVI